MDKADKLPLLRKIAGELLHWINHSYEYLLYLLGFLFIILLGNFQATWGKNPAASILFPAIILVIPAVWLILQKKVRPFKSEQDIPFINIKVKAETAFFLRQLIYTLIVLFFLVIVSFFFPSQAVYRDYSFYQALLAGSFFLLLRKRRVIITHNEPLYAKLSDVALACALFLLSWGSMANVFTFLLQFIHIAYVFIKEFVVSIATLDGGMGGKMDRGIPWEWALVAICGTAGLIISLNAELKKYRKSVWKKIISIIPLLFLASYLGSGVFFFIKKQVSGKDTIIDRFLEHYSTELFTVYNRPVSLEQAMLMNFPGVSVKPSNNITPVLRTSLSSDFDSKLVRASSTYISGTNLSYSVVRILDNNTSTCWIAKKETDNPELELVLKQPVTINAFIIKNGNQASKDLFFEYNRIAGFILTGYKKGKTVFTGSWYFKADSTNELFTPGRGCFVDKLRLEIISQHEGRSMNYCAVSDFLIIGYFGEEAPG